MKNVIQIIAILSFSTLSFTGTALACGGSSTPGNNPEPSCEAESGSSTVPVNTGTTCPDGLTFEGCCDANGTTWCENGTVFTLSCAGACGWNDMAALYDCTGAPTAEPTFTFPLACEDVGQSTSTSTDNPNEGSQDEPVEEEPAEQHPVEDPNEEAVEDEPVANDPVEDAPIVEEVPDPCSKVGYGAQGCCDGKTVYWCSEGTVQAIECANTCGWNGNQGYYDCDVEPIAAPNPDFALICPNGEEPPPWTIDNGDSEEEPEIETANEEEEEGTTLPTGSTTLKEEEEPQEVEEEVIAENIAGTPADTDPSSSAEANYSPLPNMNSAGASAWPPTTQGPVDEFVEGAASTGCQSSSNSAFPGLILVSLGILLLGKIGLQES